MTIVKPPWETMSVRLMAVNNVKDVNNLLHITIPQVAIRKPHWENSARLIMKNTLNENVPGNMGKY